MAMAQRIAPQLEMQPLAVVRQRLEAGVREMLTTLAGEADE